MPAWTPAEIALLGTNYDAAIAAKLGRSERSVQQHRKHLGILAYKMRRPRAAGRKSHGRRAG